MLQFAERCATTISRVVAIFSDMVGDGLLRLCDAISKLDDLPAHLNLSQNTVTRAYVGLQHDRIIERAQRGHQITASAGVAGLRRQREKPVISDLLAIARNAKQMGVPLDECRSIVDTAHEARAGRRR